MPIDKPLLAEALRTRTAGPFTAEEIDEMEFTDVAALLNYFYLRMSQAGKVNQLQAMRRMSFAMAAGGFAVGCIIAYAGILLLAHPVSRSLDSLTKELREASAAHALLEAVKQREKKND